MNENKMSDELEIDLKEIFFEVWKKAWLISLVAIIAAFLCFLFTKFLITPQYQSETKVFILTKQNEASVTYNDLQMGSQLTKDYKELITCRPVLENVINSLELEYSYKILFEKVSVEVPTDTRIITITVTDEDPIVAMQLADAIREEASELIKEVMDIEAVNLVEKANVAEKPSSPSTVKNTILGGGIAAFVMVVAIVLIYMLNDTIKTPDDIESKLGLSNLASIPLYGEGAVTRTRRKKK